MKIVYGHHIYLSTVNLLPTAIQSNWHLSHAHMSTVVMCVARIIRSSEQNINYPLSWKYLVSFSTDKCKRMFVGDKCQKYPTSPFIRLSPESIKKTKTIDFQCSSASIGLIKSQWCRQKDGVHHKYSFIIN